MAGKTEARPIPVIDLFAGPGGLCEGFSAVGRRENNPAFDIRLSIEKDQHAHQTLELRSFFRLFPHGQVPEAYYDFLRRVDIPMDERRRVLFDSFPEEATQATAKAWRAELGKTETGTVHNRITQALREAKDWVLLGGPPCQAYSLAGRSRNKGNPEYKAEEDERQYLYIEYLQVIADHEPTLFVMENVKGLLSATIKERRIFERILEDLKAPSTAIEREGRSVQRRPGSSGNPRYRIFSLTEDRLLEDDDLRDYLVKMESYGVPQARHRVILIGVHEKLGEIIPAALKKSKAVTTRQVIETLPALRSGLSKEKDSAASWLRTIFEAPERRWFQSSASKAGEDVYRNLCDVVEKLQLPSHDRGGEYVGSTPSIKYQPEWFLDARLDGVCNHATRGHMVKDLYRYLYAACFAQAHGKSPCLKDFPADLLPNHLNAKEALDGSTFADRFRVQTFDRPSTTITCHISKDGHYYIHPDPAQCRSMTVREAARLQTFPDNYLFCGPRTAQYNQVGNAVPPLLAIQIGEIAHDVLRRAGITD